MIKSIQISNFQSHKDTTLKFSKGVNVIQGRSDSGKTAILRALNWLINNKPAGDAFRSTWGGLTKVQIKTTEHFIRRWKEGTAKNGYSVSKMGWDEKDGPEYQDFKAFGQGVPEEISEALNMLPINFQSQLDPPFLLSDSPGEVARVLNEVASLDVIDSSLSNVAAKVRSNANEKREAEGRTLELEEELESYKGLDELDGYLTGLEQLERQAIEASSRKSELAILIGRIEEAQEELKKEVDVSGAEEILDDLEQVGKRLGKVEKEIEALNKLGKKIKEATDDLEEYEAEIEDLEKQMPKVCPTCGKELK